MYQDSFTGQQPLNNPFSQQGSAASRYPDIGGSTTPTNADPSSSQFTSWMQPQPQSPVYPASGLPSAPTGAGSPTYAQGPYSQTYGSTQFQGYGDPHQLLPQAYRSTPSYSNPMSSQAGSSYGYLQPHPSSSSTAYNPAQEQLQSNPGYMPQLDPYAAIGQGWSDPSPTSPSVPSQPAAPSKSRSGQSHPQEWIRAHKNELESWDTYAWKQLLGAFDALKESWQARKMEAEDRLNQLQMKMQFGYYDPSVQQEGARLQRVGKDAELNADSIAASVFQMHEVFSSYRQSSDVASKARVREACNAALSSLPDWPSQSF